MGSCVSKSTIDRTVTLRPAEVDPQSVEYSKSLASPGNGLTSPKQRFARRTSAHKGVMSSIAMKFPHIKRSFVACKGVFERHADPKTGTICKSSVSTVLAELGARTLSFSNGSMEMIIEKANLDGDEVIDFKEFLIAAAVGCFLRADPNTEDLSPYFLSIRKGFEAAKEAFGKIDKDGSGEIEFQELKEAFLAMKEDDLIMERLRELDFNGDKAIEFPEFVWGLSAWVGMDEDLDEDEEYDEDEDGEEEEEEEGMKELILDQPPKVQQKEEGEEEDKQPLMMNDAQKDQEQVVIDKDKEEEVIITEEAAEPQDDRTVIPGPVDEEKE